MDGWIDRPGGQMSEESD